MTRKKINKYSRTTWTLNWSLEGYISMVSWLGYVLIAPPRSLLPHTPTMAPKSISNDTDTGATISEWSFEQDRTITQRDARTFPVAHRDNKIVLSQLPPPPSPNSPWNPEICEWYEALRLIFTNMNTGISSKNDDFGKLPPLLCETGSDGNGAYTIGWITQSYICFRLYKYVFSTERHGTILILFNWSFW